MKNFKYLFLLLPFLLTSCITTKDVRYLQPSESLVINEEGLVPTIFLFTGLPKMICLTLIL